MRDRTARRPPLRALAVAAIVLASCVRQPPAPTSATVLHDDAITLASFNFPESETLADVYAIALARAGYDVKLQPNLGARELVDPALERGLVEFVPEYAGTALAFVTGETEHASDPATTHDQLRAAFAPHGVDVLAAAPGQDQNGVAVTGATAAKYDLRTISDLASVSPQFVLGGPPECPERPFCLPGLEHTYGLRFSTFTPLDSGGPITRAALGGGEIDAGILFTSDGAIDGSDLVLLKDDRHLQPAENITPVVREEVVERFGPRFVAVVDSVSALLTTHALRSMNAQVATSQTPRQAAAGFLSAWTPPGGTADDASRSDGRSRATLLRSAGLESRTMETSRGSASPLAPERSRHFPGRTVKRRRPSGEAPPLPHDLGRSGTFWIAMVGYLLAVLLLVLFFQPASHVFDQWDATRTRWVTSLRTGWLTHVALLINAVSSIWWIRILRWGTILALVVFRRWRHLFTFLGAVILVEVVSFQLATALARPRPYGITILAGWKGFSMPSRPVASVTVTLLGIVYALVVAGKPRTVGKWVAGAAVILLGLSRVYLGVDHSTDAGMAAVLAVAITLIAFRWFAPNDVFPVVYRRGKAAHLDVTGRRGEAIRQAVQDQLGLEVLEIKPVGLEGSGGSTPLRLRVAATTTEPETFLFAKLYARNHVRADRWYKIGRTILYGALEDETPFQSVRRFVEYEDYTLRLLYDVGIPTPKPYGIVEITPEREYMIVMEFFAGAVEIGDVEVNEAMIDSGLLLIRHLWDAGLAHRDVKPANFMVRDDRVLMIDVFFVQVRPSPWRQAVDLANMMLTLAVNSDAETVYRHALQYFTEDEIAEAFAATRGVASPTQLRNVLKSDGRELLDRFRSLAPERPPIAIQRWSVRRLALTLWVLFLALIAVGLVLGNLNAFAV